MIALFKKIKPLPSVMMWLISLPAFCQNTFSTDGLMKQESKVKTIHPNSEAIHFSIDPKKVNAIAFKIETAKQDTLDIYLGNSFVYRYIGPNGKSKYGADYHFAIFADSVENKLFTIIDKHGSAYTTFKIKNKNRRVWISRNYLSTWLITQSRYAILFY
jgi:hypothetical protein